MQKWDARHFQSFHIEILQKFLLKDKEGREKRGISRYYMKSEHKDFFSIMKSYKKKKRTKKDVTPFIDMGEGTALSNKIRWSTDHLSFTCLNGD